MPSKSHQAQRGDITGLPLCENQQDMFENMYAEINSRLLKQGHARKNRNKNRCSLKV